MSKKRILYISQEITPYLPVSEIANVGRHLPQGAQEKGREIRTFMPKFGCINERRNQLHEVIRLSGMNLIINDNDHPLIIKVASIQPARMQVYFIDNEDYFQRKAVLKDKEGNFFSDNDERAIFFCRGVLETVKKLGWAPDLIHCHGWMTSLIPLYLKTSYKNEPLFEKSKVITSIYNDCFKGSLDKNFAQKALMDGVTEEDIHSYIDPTHNNLCLAAAKWSDGVIIGSEKSSAFAENLSVPVLEFQGTDYIDAYSNFYDEILLEQEVLAD
ncbi:MAG: glycogen synthase [Bacteroidetes bacterium]|nr:MAG: glycogen synthase [Bacteroidota bacterium]MBL1143811.1 glycogen synthase [Bacteroidota bacterium]NOG56612.1 glycogen/starch synthase [Bacteroidota bacterium]